MLEALGLMFTAPMWFATAFAMMFVAPSIEWLLLVPFTGMASLLTAVVLWLRNGRKDMLIFLGSPAASLLIVFVAGVFRGQLDGDAATPLLVSFLAAQAIFLGFAFYRCRIVWRMAALFAYGFFSYALFSALVAVMAFTDTWI